MVKSNAWGVSSGVMVDTMVDTSDKLVSKCSDRLVCQFGPALPTAETKEWLRIFILSDVRLCREGLALLLARQQGMEVVGSAPASAGVEDIAASKPDVILLDASAVVGCAPAGRLCDAMPECKLVAFAIREVDEEVIACAEAGIVAYVKRESSSDEMIDIIHQAARGDFVCPSRLTSSLFRHIASSARQRSLHGAVPLQQDFSQFILTRREREIIPFIAKGLTNKEIARSLDLGPTTVKNHVHNILEKLGLRRRTEIAAQARLPRTR
jgi:two-component system, NarL family, nitrate/nitrite response regulator NarL